MKTCPSCHRTYSDDIEFCARDGTRLTSLVSETEAQLASGLARHFRIVRRLGAGGMGTVFLAEQITVGNRPVALKVLLRKLLDDPEFLLRFQNEAASTGRIDHHNVVTIYESGQADDGTPYIAMQYLEGESLRDALKTRGALPVEECADILLQAARGLNAAHRLGIIHRDLKPDNIFLTQEEGELVVKVVDFGIAKLRESATHTMTGTVLGTPAYMSYEQASGMKSDELDARSDIYSLGVVYEMLTGRVPFHSDTPLGYLRKHLQDMPPPFRAVRPTLPKLPKVEAVVMKALAKDRDQRYGAVLDFAREFAQAAAPASQTAPLPDTLKATVRAQPAAGEVTVPDGISHTAEHASVATTPASARGATTPTQRTTGSRASTATVAPAAVLADAQVAAAPGDAESAPEAASAAVSSTPDPERQRAVRRKRLRVTGAVVFLLMLAAAAGYWIWLAPSSALEHTLTDSGNEVESVAFSPDGRLLASGSWQHLVTLWDARTWTLKQKLNASSLVNSVAFSPDGKMLAAGEQANSITLWDVVSGTVTRTLKGHQERVASIAFSPTGNLLASASNDETVRLWDVNSGMVKRSLTGHTDYVWAVAFSPDGKLLASGSRDRTVRIWDVASGTAKQTLPADGQVTTVAFSPDGNLLAWAGDARLIQVWNMASGAQAQSLVVGAYVSSIAFSPDGRLIASGNWDSFVEVWDVGSWTRRERLRGHKHLVNSVTFSPDGKLLVSGGADYKIRIWGVPQ